jgi:rubrerythrin
MPEEVIEMDDRSLISLLQSLSQLDIDACRAYRRIVARVAVPQTRAQLIEFWRDHERHVDELGAEIHRLGGTPPEFAPDAKGVLIEGFTTLRAGTGTTGALKALKTNERLTNAAYAAALREDLPIEIEALLQRSREDERRHLAYVREALARPEHRVGVGRMVAGAALVGAGAAAAAWAISRWRAREPAAEQAERAPEPGWLVRRARPGARIAEAPDRAGMSDFGDAAQDQIPGAPANLALHGNEPGGKDDADRQR